MASEDFSTLIGLVSHYSPSGQESEAVSWLVNRMDALGYDNAYIDDAGNAVGIIGAGPKQLILLGHIDTVPGEIEVREENGILFGRGSVDAKGPLACFVDAAAAVGAHPGWQIVVIGAVEEERESDGARHAVDQYQPDFAIIGEPCRWNRVALGYKGSAWTKISLSCEHTHSASGRTTAAEYAYAAWSAISSQIEKFNRDKKRMFDRLLVTLTSVNTEVGEFEQTAVMQLGVRLPPDLPPDDWKIFLDEILTGLDIPQIEATLSSSPIAAWSSEKNTPLVRAFLSAIRDQGGKPAFVYKTGTADINLVAPAWNCPAVVYGPGDSSLDHTPNEHIDLEEFKNSVAALANVLDTLLT